MYSLLTSSISLSFWFFSLQLTLFARAAITKYHELGGLNNRNLFALSSGGQLFDEVLSRTGFYEVSLLDSLLSIVQSLSCLLLFKTPWTAACQASLSFTLSHSLLKLMSIESMMASNHLILCHPLLPLPSILPSIQVFSNDSTLRIKWPKYWSFSFSISPSNEYSGLISFRIGWLDFPAVQGTLKSCFQHHNFKVSVFQCSASFMGPTITSVHDYWKNHSFDCMDLDS